MYVYIICEIKSINKYRPYEINRGTSSTKLLENRSPKLQLKIIKELTLQVPVLESFMELHCFIKLILMKKLKIWQLN